VVVVASKLKNITELEAITQKELDSSEMLQEAELDSSEMLQEAGVWLDISFAAGHHTKRVFY